MDSGKPLDETAWDIVSLWIRTDFLGFGFVLFLRINQYLYTRVQDDVAACFEYYADQAEALDAKQKAPITLPMDTFKCHVLRQPIGVVGLISPWLVLTSGPLP